MANSGKVEAENESEPEESVLLRRRSEASEDDEEVEEEGNKMAVRVRLNRGVRRSGYADESDGHSGAPEYYDDDEEEVSYVDELEELGAHVDEERKEEVAEQVTATKQRGKEKVNDGDNDAFAVPRTGTFYMHDDRFSGLHRRSRDQRRKRNIWESKDELKWMHDKFEEMKLEKGLNTEFNVFEVRRTSNDYRQGYSKNNTKSGGYKAKESRLHSKSGNNGSSLKMVKGRGPVRYKPLSRSISGNPPMKSMQLEKIRGTSPKTDSARVVSANDKEQFKRSLGKPANADSEGALSTRCRQPAKPLKMTGDTDSSTVVSAKSKQSRNVGMISHAVPASVSFHCLNVDCDSLPPSQHLPAPRMSSYQQALYSATSFRHDISATQKRMVLPGSRNGMFPGSVLPNQIIHVPLANDFLQGNIAQDIPHAKEGVSAVAENYFSKLSFQYSVPGSTYISSPDSRDQRTISFTHQATLFPNQLNRVSSLARTIVQQMPVDGTIQPPSQVFTQQSHSRLGSGSQEVCEASSVSFHEPGIFESLEGSIPSKVASLGTGSNITAPPQYTGIPSDQNFSATPILFPVMPIGGPHRGTLGDPSIDMSSTGYIGIGESQVHLRNPDLTWLPILPAATGAACQPPYVSPGGSCYSNFTTTPTVDIASSATRTSIPSDEAGVSGPINGSLPSSETEQTKNEHERFKPARYSRMSMKE